MGKRSQVALSFIHGPRKGARQRCHLWLKDEGRISPWKERGLRLLFLAKEAMAVTGVPEAGFRVERSALSTLLFFLARA